MTPSTQRVLMLRKFGGPDGFAVVERPAATPCTSAAAVLLRDVCGRLQIQVKQTTQAVNRLHNLLARAFPETPIVLDHVGGAIGLGRYAGKRDEVFAEWKQSVGELARCPNVHVKLGGLGMRLFGFDVHTGATPPGSEQLAGLWRPYIETCIEAFGPERAMFESNFPVDKGGGSYHVFWNAFKRLAAGCSAADKAALFSGTASKFYRLG